MLSEVTGVPSMEAFCTGALAQKHSAGPDPKQDPVRKHWTVPPMFLEKL